jgi:hypothetical protein
MMLKLFFWLLVLANGALLAYHQGALNSIFPDGREPARANRQINPGAVRLVAPPVLLAASASAQAEKPAVFACVEIGNFDTPEALRFEERMAAIAPQLKPSRQAIHEVARNMVLIPPQGSKEAADKKAAELKRRGVTDFFVIQEGEQRWAISLGIFKTEEAAQAHLAALKEKDVRTARLGLFNATVNKTAFQFRAMDAAANAEMLKLKAEFPKQEMRACSGASPS